MLTGQQTAAWCNAIDALEDHEPAPAIKNLLVCLLLSSTDESPAIRESLVCALYPYCFTDPKLVELLQSLTKTETSPAVRETIRMTLECADVP